MKEMHMFNNKPIISLKGEDRFILSSTSKGNQIKWYKDGAYYKADSFGYEGLAEVMSNVLAQYIKDFNYTPYKLCTIIEDDRQYTCCYCESFLKEGESYLSFVRILELLGFDFRSSDKDGMKTTFENVCAYVEKASGLDVRNFLAKALYFDSLILNEDRHLNNIGIINCGNGYRIAPYFDNGLSMMSDVRDYPLESDFYENLKRVHAKPFLRTFERQVKVLNEMEFPPLVIDYDPLLEELDNFTSSAYSKDEIVRCRAVLKVQLRKFEGKAWKRL